MKKLIGAVSLAIVLAEPALAASVSKTYSYFNIGGRTIEEIEVELSRRGPKMEGTGRRHPGATRMEFTTRVSYAEAAGSCRIGGATVSVKAKVILPRWRARGKAERETRIIWDTLAADIKRHEESHISIAKNHAREMEKALTALPAEKTCQAVAQRAKATNEKILARHDAEQARFDRVEGKNFETRLIRLLKYRLERIADGRIPG